MKPDFRLVSRRNTFNLIIIGTIKDPSSLTGLLFYVGDRISNTRAILRGFVMFVGEMIMAEVRAMTNKGLQLISEATGVGGIVCTKA